MRARVDAVDDLAVALLQALDVLDPLDQVGEVVGADDQRDDVRLGLLVVGHELGGELVPVLGQAPLEPHQLRALGCELGPGGRQPRLRGREVGLDLGQPPLDDRDVVLRAGEQITEARDRAGELLLARLALLDLVAQRALVLRDGRQRKDRPEGENSDDEASGAPDRRSTLAP